MSSSSLVTRVRSLHLLRIGLITAGSLVAIAAIGYGVAYAIVGDGVLPNTTVSGLSLPAVSIGRMTPAAAARVSWSMFASPRAALTSCGVGTAMNPSKMLLCARLSAGSRYPTYA